MTKRPSQKDKGPTPREISQVQEFNQRFFDLDSDMERAFERFEEYDSRIATLEAKFPKDFSMGQLLERVQLLEQMVEVVEGDLSTVEDRTGYASRKFCRRRILAHKAAGGGQHSTNEDEDARMAEAAGMVHGAAGPPDGPPVPASEPQRSRSVHSGVLTGIDPGAAGEPQRCWQPAPRAPEVMEHKALQDLYRMAQDRAGVLVSARNVVEMYTSFLEDLDYLIGMKKPIEEALGPFAKSGESLADTAARIGDIASEMSDPVRMVLGECQVVKMKIDLAMERLREQDLENVEDTVSKLNRTAEKMASDVENIGLQFMSIDSLPLAIEGLDKTLEALSKLTTDSSIVTEVPTPELSPHVWGILCLLHANEDECDVCKKKAKDLNVAVGRAIEGVLMWTLKEGRGFKKGVLGKNIEMAMSGVVNPVISVTGIDGSVVKEVYDLAKHQISEYFGMTY